MRRFINIAIQNSQTMKIFASSIIIAATCGVISCKSSVKVDIDKSDETTASEMTYDSTLAKKYGADEYGMKQYVIAFLKKGDYQEPDSIKEAEVQRAHLDNIFRMMNEGKLSLAGPFLDTGDIRGIYIFNVPTIEEAKTLTETDPAIQSGRFVMELHPFYGSAAVVGIPEQHKRVAKKPI